MTSAVIGMRPHIVSLLGSLWSAFTQIFVMHRLGEIDFKNVRKRREPREHIRELLLKVGAIGIGAFAALVLADGVGQLADFLGKP